MNSFDIVFNELKKNSGMAVDIKRKSKDGSLVDARNNELASLGTKATVASTAGLLKKLTQDERLEWAIETKNEANALFAQHQYREAMAKYVEALAASDFGRGSCKGDENSNPSKDNEDESVRVDQTSQGNVDTLVVPVLCNLAASCIQIQEWSKVVSFGEQAVLLRPHCSKAHLRSGIGLMNIGEYSLAIKSFRNAKKYAMTVRVDDEVNNDNVVCNDVDTNDENYRKIAELSEADWQRLPMLMGQAKRGKQQQKIQLTRQKQSLQKAFTKVKEQEQHDLELEEDDYDCGEDQGSYRYLDDCNRPTLQAMNTQNVAPTKAKIMTLAEIVAFIWHFLMNLFHTAVHEKKEN